MSPKGGPTRPSMEKPYNTVCVTLQRLPRDGRGSTAGVGRPGRRRLGRLGGAPLHGGGRENIRAEAPRSSSEPQRAHLCQFPRAALRKSHKLGGLEQQKFILAQFWKLEAPMKVLAGQAPPEGYEGRPVPYPLLPGVGSWGHHADLHLHHHVAFPLCILLHIPFCKD